jgi:acyl-CoA reductase-like NAD-dependent aldehyde dehydrogenase
MTGAGARVTVIEPATEQVLAELPRAGAEEADAAVARAKAAFPAWRAVTPRDRGRILATLAEAIDDHLEDLAQLEARNAGKPIGDARGEMGMVVETFRYYAGAPERLLGDTIPVAGGIDLTFREPLGVVALIVPWNFPLTIAAWKVAPALAAGNTVVLKPAELTPLTALELERHVLALRVGDPLDETTEIGPLISSGHRETVASFLTDGAPVAFTGSAPEGPGYWFPPTVLGPIDNHDRAAREEIFGPIACVIPFEGETEAVRVANDTVYGLSGSIWTGDGARALRVARLLDTGVLSINSNTSVRVPTPFGGFKQSGVGRELGPHALEHYTEVKNVYYATEAT